MAKIKADAYPQFLDVMAILFLLNLEIMLLIGKLRSQRKAYIQKYTQQADITP